MNGFVKKKFFCLCILLCLLFSTSCRGIKAKLGMEVINEPLVVEIEKENTEKTAEKPAKVSIKNNLSVVYSKQMIWEKGQEMGYLVPIGISQNVFEYNYRNDLYRLNLNTLKEEVLEGVFDEYYFDPHHSSNILNDELGYYFWAINEINEQYQVNLICKSRSNNMILWKTTLYKLGPFYSYIAPLYQNDQYVFACVSQTFQLYCLEKKTGKVVWTFDPTKFEKNLSYRANNDSMVDIGSKFIRVDHDSKNGIVVHLHSEDQGLNDDKLNQPIVDKFYLVSPSGVLINTFDQEPLEYFENTYFFHNGSSFGYKNMIDNQVVWQNQGIDLFKESDFQQIGTCLIQNKKDMKGLHLTFYDQKDGSIKWSKTLQATEDFSINELDGKIYIFYEDNKNYDEYYLKVWDPISKQEEEVELVNQINKNFTSMDEFSYEPEFTSYLMSNSMINTNADRINIILGLGWITIQGDKAIYQPYQNIKACSNVLFDNFETFHVLSFIPSGQGGIPGGEILVLKDIAK